MAQPRLPRPFRTNPVSVTMSADGTAPPAPRSHIRGQAYCKPTVLPRPRLRFRGSIQASPYEGLETGTDIGVPEAPRVD